MTAPGTQSIYETECDLTTSSTPTHKQVLTWLLILPLLNMVAKGSLSFLSPPATAFSYQNGDLLKTSGDIRIPIVVNLLFLAGFTLAGNRKIWKELINNRIIFLTLFLAAISSLWSESPFITLRMSAEVTLTTLFACYLSTRMSTERLMSLLMFVGVLAAALSAILAVAMPQYGIFQGYAGGAWQGICIHKNTLGLGMAFLLTPVFFVNRSLALKLGYSTLLLFLIAMSQSRGAWFETAGMLLFIAWIWIFRRLTSRDCILLMLTTTAMVGGIVALAISHIETVMRFIGKDPTLTGRTDIYAAVLESCLKHPLLGYGFGAFWHGLNNESLNIALRIHWINIGYAENGPLELVLQLGTVGLGLIMLILGRAIVQCIRLNRPRYYNSRIGWFSTIIALELFTNIESGWLMVANTLDWTMTLVACIGLANETRLQINGWRGTSRLPSE
jgi:exopolysaccharide production protein ExoQ